MFITNHSLLQWKKKPGKLYFSYYNLFQHNIFEHIFVNNPFEIQPSSYLLFHKRLYIYDTDISSSCRNFYKVRVWIFCGFIGYREGAFKNCIFGRCSVEMLVERYFHLYCMVLQHTMTLLLRGLVDRGDSICGFTLVLFLVSPLLMYY